jgi:hypothetical protein
MSETEPPTEPIASASAGGSGGLVPTTPGPTRPAVPAGWYPHGPELRYWDGSAWTEHRAPAQAAQPPAVHPSGYAPAYVQPAYVQPYVVTDARTNSVEVVFAWIFTVLTLGYMLPWAIAATRGKSNSWAVGLLNFLLGWTFIGWVAALIMACMAHQVAAVRNY